MVAEIAQVELLDGRNCGMPPYIKRTTSLHSMDEAPGEDGATAALVISVHSSVHA